MEGALLAHFSLTVKKETGSLLQVFTVIEARYIAKTGWRGTFFLLCRIAPPPPPVWKPYSPPPPPPPPPTHVRYIEYPLFYLFSDTGYALSLKKIDNKTAAQKIEFGSPCFCFVHAQVTTHKTDWNIQAVEQHKRNRKLIQSGVIGSWYNSVNRLRLKDD